MVKLLKEHFTTFHWYHKHLNARHNLRVISHVQVWEMLEFYIKKGNDIEQNYSQYFLA